MSLLIYLEFQSCYSEEFGAQKKTAHFLFFIVCLFSCFLFFQSTKDNETLCMRTKQTEPNYKCKGNPNDSVMQASLFFTLVLIMVFVVLRFELRASLGATEIFF